MKKRKEKEMEKIWLYGWKSIAEYIGCTVWTAKIYYKKFDLPVDRLPLGKPVAKAEKIDSWIETIKKPHENL